MSWQSHSCIFILKKKQTFSKNLHMRAQQTKAPAAKPGHLSSVFRFHTVEGKTDSHKLSCDLHMHSSAHLFPLIRNKKMALKTIKREKHFTQIF